MFAKNNKRENTYTNLKKNKNKYSKRRNSKERKSMKENRNPSSNIGKKKNKKRRNKYTKINIKSILNYTDNEAKNSYDEDNNFSYFTNSPESVIF